MSCGTLSAGLVGLNVSMASLPEGFCPTSMQDLANNIAARLIVTPNQASSSFAIGSVPPTSNVGPWFKDCEVWFVYDDATGTYIPMRKGGFDSLQYFSASGTFIVPADIYKIKIEAFGGGGGGRNRSTFASAAGGGGAYGLAIRDVLPGQNIPIIIGSAGANGSPGTPGGDTSLLGMVATGGGGAASDTISGAGGTATGFDVNISGQAGGANSAPRAEDPGGYGGDAGGWGGKGGAAGCNDPAAGNRRNGLPPGGGGAGGSTTNDGSAGSGAAGGVLIQY